MEARACAPRLLHARPHLKAVLVVDHGRLDRHQRANDQVLDAVEQLVGGAGACARQAGVTCLVGGLPLSASCCPGSNCWHGCTARLAGRACHSEPAASRGPWRRALWPRLRHAGSPCLPAMYSRRLRMGHFMPLARSKPGACFWMATLVRWMKVLPMSSFFMLYRALVKRAKPLLRTHPGGGHLPARLALLAPHAKRFALAHGGSSTTRGGG